MKLKNMTLTELKALSYTDIAYMILKENKKTYTTPVLFHKICDLLGYTDEEYATKIGDFYTSLTTDCRFIILDTAEWDLRDKHVVKLEVDDDEDEEITEEEIESDDDSAEEPVATDDADTVDEIDDDVDDDLEDLSIVDGDENIDEN